MELLGVILADSDNKYIKGLFMNEISCCEIYVYIYI